VEATAWSEQGVPEALLRPRRLFAGTEVMSKASPIPRQAGVYAWYFDEIPHQVDVSGCHTYGGKTLLYVGISPSAPPTNGKAPSRSHLHRRVRTHYGGNASGSTLRLTLGCLLADQLKIELRRVGSGQRYTFTNPGEQVLDRWMDAHAFISVFPCERPWEIEGAVLQSGLPLPLNISGNPQRHHPEFLTPLRCSARARANKLEVISDAGGPRRSSRSAIF
jgi:hypothetical protein